jgi:hypothetical protein
MGTDSHRNTLPQIFPDGERGDSFRRMMIWFSNHLLVTPEVDGTFTDQRLKQALAAGRLYGAFEMFGYPLGFDYHAVEGAEVREMGSEASLANGPRLEVKMPRVKNLDPEVEPPALTARILRAKEGGWDIVASGSSDLSFAVETPGAYRAEVRIAPKHLRHYLGSYAGLADGDFVWIYSNAIYVVP